jgi:hypothetical protein
MVKRSSSILIPQFLYMLPRRLRMHRSIEKHLRCMKVWRMIYMSGGPAETLATRPGMGCLVFILIHDDCTRRQRLLYLFSQKVQPIIS